MLSPHRQMQFLNFDLESNDVLLLTDPESVLRLNKGHQVKPCGLNELQTLYHPCLLHLFRRLRWFIAAFVPQSLTPKELNSMKPGCELCVHTVKGIAPHDTFKGSIRFEPRGKAV